MVAIHMCTCACGGQMYARYLLKLLFIISLKISLKFSLV